MTRGPRYLLSAAMLCLSVAGSSAQAYSLSLTFDPASQIVNLGGEAIVAVRISDVLSGGLGACDFDVTFDSDLLFFDRAPDGLVLGFAVGLNVALGLGSVKVSDFSLQAVADLLALQGNEFVLFSLVFDTHAAGTSALRFEQVTLGDAAAGPVTPADLRAGSITVETGAVPEPSSMALVLGALLVGAMPNWRRRR